MPPGARAVFVHFLRVYTTDPGPLWVRLVAGTAARGVVPIDWARRKLLLRRDAGCSSESPVRCAADMRGPRELMDERGDASSGSMLWPCGGATVRTLAGLVPAPPAQPWPSITTGVPNTGMGCGVAVGGVGGAVVTGGGGDMASLSCQARSYATAILAV